MDEFILPFKIERDGARVREYFQVEVPADLAESAVARAEYALYLAREQAALHVTPCLWEVEISPESDDGEYETYIVIRESHNRAA